MWAVSAILLNIATPAQDQLQMSLLTQYHIFPQSSSKLRPITTTEGLLCANMWSVRTADTDLIQPLEKASSPKPTTCAALKIATQSPRPLI